MTFYRYLINDASDIVTMKKILLLSLLSLIGTNTVANELGDNSIEKIKNASPKVESRQCIKPCTRTFCIDGLDGEGFLTAPDKFSISVELLPEKIKGTVRNSCEFSHEYSTYVQGGLPPYLLLKKICATLDVVEVPVLWQSNLAT